MLDRSVRPGISEQVVIDDNSVREIGDYWVFPYNTREYLSSGSISHALTGNGPIIVSKSDGSSRFARSGIPVEDQL
jgi:hypothetical protein